MKFRFRFEVLLNLRGRQRDEAGAAVGQANAAIEKVSQQIRDIDQQRDQLRDRLRRSTAAGPIAVDRLLSGGRFDLMLLADRRSLEETRGKLNVELQRRQSVLTAAEAEVKKLEKLKEHDLKNHRETLRLREQSEIDDATSRNYTRIIQAAQRQPRQESP